MIAVFAVGVYYWAVATSLKSAEIRRNIEEVEEVEEAEEAEEIEEVEETGAADDGGH